MYFMICKAVDMAPQPIRYLWSGNNNKIFKKRKEKEPTSTILSALCQKKR